MPEIDIYRMSAKLQAIIHFFATKGSHTWLQVDQVLRYSCKDAIGDLKKLGILCSEPGRDPNGLMRYKITEGGLNQYKQFLRRQHSVLAGAPADVQELLSSVTPPTYHGSIFSDLVHKPFIPARGTSSLAAFSVPSRGLAC